MTIVEVSPRDGLQNDPALLTTEQKLELVGRCVAAGVRRIEVASFVNPQRVPQMADAEAVLDGLSPDALAGAIGLVLNERGMERAARTKVPEVNVVVVSTRCHDTSLPTTSSPTSRERISWICGARARSRSAASGPSAGSVNFISTTWRITRVA